MSRIRADRIVNRAGNGAPEFPYGIVVSGVVSATTFDQNISGIVSATGGFNINVQSSGVSIANTIKTLNFTGAQNTFAYNPTTKVVDVNISGVSATGINTGGFWSNPNTINAAVSLTNPNHNYGMFGPVQLNATVTVGAGNTFIVV